MYKNKLTESEDARSSIISSLVRNLMERNYEPEDHIKRLRQFTLQIGDAVRLTNSELNDLHLLASLHDIGKLAIPDVIIKRRGSLSKREWETVKKHSEIGYRIARSSRRTASIAEAILTHHEWWDGAGYPLGLKGNEIPFISRIFTIIDAYDVMTHDRVYSKTLNHEEALKELRRCAGTQFDPKLVELFSGIFLTQF
jgi:HD-GYP domain-containing protein (c-di-GMP phosphodiesterase class II)